MATDGRDVSDFQPAVLASFEAFDGGSARARPPVAEWPGDLDLPWSDGEIVENFAELPQAALLTTSIRPLLDRLHPDGRYMTAGNSGIYWDYLEPPLRGAVAPDWFYVPGVDGSEVAGHMRRSYVMWKELQVPFLVMEFVSGDGRKERDRTPGVGKFWVYEQRVKATYYVIFEPFRNGEFEVHRREGGLFRPLVPNARGHVPIPELGVELGVLPGTHDNITGPFLRWYDEDGELLLSGWERADVLETEVKRESRRAESESRRAESESRRAEAESRRAAALAAKLRSLGIDPDEVSGSA